MNANTYEIGFEALDGLTVDSLCLFVSEDERPLPGTAGFVDWRLCGSLSRILLGGFFVGARGDRLLVPTASRLVPERLFLIGLGKSATLDAKGVGELLEGAAQVLTLAGSRAAALEVPGNGVVSDAARADALNKHFLPAFKGQVAVLAEKPLKAILTPR